MTTTQFPSRKFGFEFETTIHTSHTAEQFKVGRYHNGELVQGGDGKWNCQRDASVKSQKTGYTGVEIVSSILKGIEGLAEVMGMVDYLQEIEAHSNGSCGIHVHVDARDISFDTLEKIKAVFASYELAFYGLNGKEVNKRYNNQYCKPSSQWDGSKYQSLNWVPFVRGGKKQTLECRVFASKVDALHAISAVILFVGLVDGVVNGTLEACSNRHTCDDQMKALILALGLHKDEELRGELIPFLMKQAMEAELQMHRARTGDQMAYQMPTEAEVLQQFN